MTNRKAIDELKRLGYKYGIIAMEVKRGRARANLRTQKVAGHPQSILDSAADHVSNISIAIKELRSEGCKL